MQQAREIPHAPETIQHAQFPGERIIEMSIAVWQAKLPYGVIHWFGCENSHFRMVAGSYQKRNLARRNTDS
jgi:hypothetical protein